MNEAKKALTENSVVPLGFWEGFWTAAALDALGFLSLVLFHLLQDPRDWVRIADMTVSYVSKLAAFAVFLDIGIRSKGKKIIGFILGYVLGVLLWGGVVFVLRLIVSFIALAFFKVNFL